MVILLSSHRNVPIRAICLLLLTKQRIFVFYYTTEIITTPEVVIQFPWPTMLEYIALLNLNVGEARVIEETGQFFDSSVKVKNALAWFKKKRGIKCEKLGGFVAEYNLRFFYEENDEISLGTRFMTALAKVYENVFQGLWVMNLWCKCLKGTWFNKNRI